MEYNFEFEATQTSAKQVEVPYDFSLPATQKKPETPSFKARMAKLGVYMAMALLKPMILHEGLKRTP
jgi:hypothetical protein